ncbi:hypothetical protein THII_1022 [Thioploca ingrica]|uniref:Secreted protein n=1 Tax=Thioploca ingrica TaxID=40754 RepID=A0A090AEH8_9GAMM|nr:hypothetical protein THII_1022 [Thioploca ingrica]
MKKTSLVLAISALLYGTSSVYVLADDVILSDFINENGELIDSTLDLPAGFDLAQPLPGNVAIDDSYPAIERHTIKMCDPSFQVDGPAMAKFPVTVNGELGTWNGSTVTGTGWELKLPPADSWNSAWKLTVDPGTVITSILLEPSLRQEPDGRWYAFDVGGKLPKYPADRPPYEHTPDSARGQSIVQRVIDNQPVDFKAIYSGPVYTPKHNVADSIAPISTRFSGDSTTISFSTANGGTGPNKPADRIPTHDLYSTLKIEFPDGLIDNVKINPDFSFVADTDCLPVSEVAINSYENGVLNFTVVGEGAVAIMDAQKLVQGPFMVERGTGQATFTTQFVPTAGSCYNMMDVDTLKVMTKDYCF